MQLYHYISIRIFNPATLLGAVFFALVVIVLGWIAGKILRLMVHRALTRANSAGVDSTSIRFLGELSKVVVYIVAFLIYANTVPALQSLGTAWLASVSVATIVIGLAMQTTLSNLVSGIALILYRPFRIGERIQVMTPAGPEIGTVDSIDLGYTSLCTSDGRRIVLPNSIVTSQTNVNFSRTGSNVLFEVSLTAAPATNVDDLREILLDAATEIKKITKINGCFATSLTAQGTTVIFSGMCADPGDVARVKSDLLLSAQKHFKKKKIVLA